MIPETRLQELLVSVHPDATRLPPGWLAYARLVEQETQNQAVAPLPELPQAWTQIATILDGIDLQQTDAEHGWWQTSTGAAFGADRLAQLMPVVQSLVDRIAELELNLHRAKIYLDGRGADIKRLASDLEFSQGRVKMLEHLEKATPAAPARVVIKGRSVGISTLDAAMRDAFQTDEKAGVLAALAALARSSKAPAGKWLRFQADIQLASKGTALMRDESLVPAPIGNPPVPPGVVDLTSGTSPGVDRLIVEVMGKHPGMTPKALATYYEAVHQELAPHARQLERELAQARAEIQALEEALNDASEGRRRGRMSPT